ncbi:sigma-70 family RNA polymerase sigma factor, partial [Streptomyces durbertensis]
MSSRREHPTNTTSAPPARRGARRNAQRAGLPDREPAGAAVAEAVAPPAGVALSGSPSGSPYGSPSAPLSGSPSGLFADAAESGTAAASAPTAHPASHPADDPASDDAHLDGLFTYCLSVMCDHDEAVTALGQALAIAERQRERGRAPAHALQRPWLYALARWSCLRRLNALRQQEREGRRVQPVKVVGPLATQRRRELAALSWPEAAGTTPEQREALELAVRHRMPVEEVAVVLGLEIPAARLLLSGAACEVERTRAALSVVDSGGCAAISRLGGDTGLVLSAALRRELVRHVDECPACRLVAERHMAGEPWPGTSPGRSRPLPVLAASRPVVHAALVSALRARSQPMPRFDRRGFPLEVKDRSARLEKLRSRAVTSTVVAAVVAAPVLALWAAYRGAPLVGEGRDDASVSAHESDGPGVEQYPYENAGSAGRAPGAAKERARPGERPEDGASVTVEAEAEPDPGDTPEDPERSPEESPRAPEASPSGPSPGRLTVQAQPADGATLITLTNSGGTAVNWSAYAEGRWLRLSQRSGTLQPGESYTITVRVNRRREPAGDWVARVHIAPANAVITIEGRGRTPDPAPSEPNEP